MNPGSLLLAPASPDLALGDGCLEAALHRIGLTGAPLAMPGAFCVGDEFLNLIGFMGCSTHVDLEPRFAGDTDFCHIRLLGVFDAPRLLVGVNTRPPRCPECRKPVGKDWEQALATPPLQCPHCCTLLPVERLGWRHTAGLARQFVQIIGVFPGEALPQDHLLDTLGRLGIGAWGYFHVQEDRFL